MKIKALLFGLALPMAGFAQEFHVEDQTLPNEDNAPAPCHPVPHPRQILWNETEFYAFFHYGMNTFTGREWGNGDEKETIYAPKGKPDPEQWVTSVKAAGMNGGIAVVKHHDGFCLWPTATTTHSIAKAGNANGRETNIPQLFAEASKKHDMKYGFYISPWDRNSAHYGKDTYVTEVFLKQCEELAAYGNDQFEMWFDGANGGDGYYGGEGGSRTIDASIYYDVPNLRAKVHTVAPNCVMWGVGAEARWIGNEAGWAGDTNWAMTDYARDELINRQEGDINGWFWNPGESDAKATNNGWFWHNGETMKSAERLFQMYLETVGRNATLILNCPPDQRGLLPDNTVNELKKLGRMLHERLAVPVYGMDETTAATDLAKSATIEVSETRTGGKYEAACLTDGDKETYWATNDDTREATITLTWDTPQTLRYLMLQEPIKLGQRIKDFKVEYSVDGDTWKELCPTITSTVGYKRILPLNGKTAESYGQGYQAKQLRITILDSRACPLLSNLSVF